METKKENRQKVAENGKPSWPWWTFKRMALQRTALTTHRMTISLLIISILSGLAAKSGAESVYEIIRANELNLLKWQIWIPTVVFLATLFRFLLGNVIHISILVSEDVRPYTWLFDVSVIALEFLLFNIIGNFLIREDIIMFSNLLRFLLCIDVLWIIIIAIGYAIGKGKGDRKSVPWKWGFLNSLAVVLVSFQLATPSCLSVSQDCGLILMGVIMVVIAILDITFDVYGLLRH